MHHILKLRLKKLTRVRERYLI